MRAKLRMRGQKFRINLHAPPKAAPGYIGGLWAPPKAAPSYIGGLWAPPGYLGVLWAPTKAALDNFLVFYKENVNR